MQIRKIKKKEIPLAFLCIEDAKELLKSKGSTQWQDTDGYPNIDDLYNDYKENKVFVALINNSIAGVITLSYKPEKCYENIFAGQWLTDNKIYGVIHRIATKKEYYHQHVGSKLIKHTIRIAKKDNIQSIRIDTMENNLPMKHIIIENGFNYCGKINLLRVNVLDPLRDVYERKV